MGATGWLHRHHLVLGEEERGREREREEERGRERERVCVYMYTMYVCVQCFEYGDTIKIGD